MSFLFLFLTYSTVGVTGEGRAVYSGLLPIRSKVLSSLSLECTLFHSSRRGHSLSASQSLPLAHLSPPDSWPSVQCRWGYHSPPSRPQEGAGGARSHQDGGQAGRASVGRGSILWPVFAELPEFSGEAHAFLLRCIRNFTVCPLCKKQESASILGPLGIYPEASVSVFNNRDALLFVVHGHMGSGGFHSTVQGPVIWPGFLP